MSLIILVITRAAQKKGEDDDDAEDDGESSSEDETSDDSTDKKDSSSSNKESSMNINGDSDKETSKPRTDNTIQKRKQNPMTRKEEPSQQPYMCQTPGQNQ